MHIQKLSARWLRWRPAVIYVTLTAFDSVFEHARFALVLHTAGEGLQSWHTQSDGASDENMQPHKKQDIPGVGGVH